jgi:two-component system catabolic regulation response regulator CreB
MAPRPVIEASSALFRIDPERIQILYRGQTLNLTRHEFRLLQCLLEQPERVFSREQLLDALGVAADAGYERSIDSHIKSVRAKLRLVRADAEPIQTHRGLGYSYSPGHS